ncbi:MAG TPA: Ni/Fe-hydrogenase, b-type cytochrome subunit [Opitutaceae bacterium]|nr:Ni/Fe-hydrogenase, b-type cytochrome subunit [Opitutaceae bacterium]
MDAPRTYVRVYVWELPVRIFHWLNALCIAVLCVTGYLIAHPPALVTSREAGDLYTFGVIRFIHFAAAYVFVGVLLLRLYWAFAGNRFARWNNFLPLTRRQLQETLDVAKIEVLQVSDRPLEPLGHNAVAYFSYTAMFLLALFQIVSGFALYAGASGSWFPRLFAWVTPLFGSEYRLRTFHSAAMWLFVAFILMHVYLSCYEDYVDGRGAISSMIGGWKFKERKKDDGPAR